MDENTLKLIKAFGDEKSSSSAIISMLVQEIERKDAIIASLQTENRSLIAKLDERRMLPTGDTHITNEYQQPVALVANTLTDASFLKKAQ